jgi:hypothetical protein
VAALPHLLYHLTALDSFSAGDAVAEIAGLTLNVVLPLGLLVLTRAPATTPVAAGAGR